MRELIIAVKIPSRLYSTSVKVNMLENTLGDLPKDVPIDLPPKNTEYGIDFLNSFKCID